MTRRAGSLQSPYVLLFEPNRRRNQARHTSTIHPPTVERQPRHLGASPRTCRPTCRRSSSTSGGPRRRVERKQEAEDNAAAVDRVRTLGANVVQPDKSKFQAAVASIHEEVARELKVTDILQMIRDAAR